MTDPSIARVTTWLAEYTPKLLPVARALCVRPDEGEDLLQEVWVVALRQEHTLGAGEDPGPWLHRILFNLARSRGRTAVRRRGLLSRWWSFADWATSSGRSPTLESEQLKLLLWREIAGLPELQARVVMLRVVAGLSTAETARAINKAEGTVKVCLHRALMRLESRLKAQGVEFSGGVTSVVGRQ
jgi:RNA polymerase sigma-70 factor, ECF subfamily